MIANSYAYRPPTVVTQQAVKLLPTSVDPVPSQRFQSLFTRPARLPSAVLFRQFVPILPPVVLDAPPLGDPVRALQTLLSILAASQAGASRQRFGPMPFAGAIQLDPPPLGDPLRALQMLLSVLTFPAPGASRARFGPILPISVDPVPSQRFQALFMRPPRLPAALSFRPGIPIIPPQGFDTPPIGNDPFRNLQVRIAALLAQPGTLSVPGLVAELIERLLPTSVDRLPLYGPLALAEEGWQSIFGWPPTLPFDSWFPNRILPPPPAPATPPPLGNQLWVLQLLASLTRPLTYLAQPIELVLPVSSEDPPLGDPRRLRTELLTRSGYPPQDLGALRRLLFDARMLPVSIDRPPVGGPLGLDEEAWQTIFRWPETLPIASWFRTFVLPPAVVLDAPPLGDPLRALTQLLALLVSIQPSPGSRARFGPRLPTSIDPVPLGKPFWASTELFTRQGYPASSLGVLDVWEALQRILPIIIPGPPLGDPFRSLTDRMTGLIYLPPSLGVLEAWEAIDRLLPVSSERPPIGDPLRLERLIQVVASVDREAAQVLRLFFRPTVLPPPPVVIAALRRALLVRLFGPGGGRSDRD